MIIIIIVYLLCKCVITVYFKQMADLELSVSENVCKRNRSSLVLHTIVVLVKTADQKQLRDLAELITIQLAHLI